MLLEKLHSIHTRILNIIATEHNSRSTYRTISDERLCSVVTEVLKILPDAGETYIVEACRQRNIFVKCQHIRDALNAVDSVSRALRRSSCIIR